MAPLTLISDKAALRRRMRELRRTCDPRLGLRLAEHLLGSGLLRTGAVVAGYWPLPTEMDVLPVLHAAHALGHPIALPITPPAGAPLGFRRWHPEAPLRPGRFGTQEPEGEAITPHILLLPLLAFDRSGNRLGYGGGFYDRTLEALEGMALAIGCGYVAQEMDRVPVDTHDWRMDAIATEAGVFLVE